MSFLGDDRSWRRYTYDELADSVGVAAARILESTSQTTGGIRCVAIMLSSGPQFVAAFFGALRAGCTPCPLIPPSGLQSRSDYLNNAAAILAVARPVALVTEAAHRETAAEAMRRSGAQAPVIDLPASGTPARGPMPELGLLQFTSGSTGRPRGVRVTLANLEANISMIHRWVGFGPGTTLATWLPLYHDMGLIGTLLAPIAGGHDAYVMKPEQFVMEPRSWLECFGRLGATTTASPSFGFGYAAKRLSPSDLAGLDLSGWRAAIAGAERLDAAAMSRFARLAAHAGFRAETFLPAYGMAEASLAITGVPLEEVPAVAKLDWSALRFGEPVRVLDTARLDQGDRIGAGDGWALDCGAPLDGLSVEVIDESGAPLPDGSLGEVLVSGPSVADGYCAGSGSGATVFTATQEVRTGDAGFVRDGRLFILGRIADSLSLRGQSLYADDLETMVATIDGVSRGRFAIFTGIEAEGPAIVALVEDEPGPWAQQVGRKLAKLARDDASVYVLRAPRGTIERTSSGKPRRRAMFHAFLEGTLAAEPIWSNTAGESGRSRGGESRMLAPARQ
ncbi:MAG: AMP-binding protein [Solirubrobacteraceae bacterium]